MDLWREAVGKSYPPDLNGKGSFLYDPVKWTAALGGLLFAFLIVSIPARAADNAPQTRSYSLALPVPGQADQAASMAENDARTCTICSRTKATWALSLITSDCYRQADASCKSEPATADNILKAVKWLAESSKKDDLAIFAIIGEGAPFGDKAGRLCYLGVDSKLADRSKTAVPAGELAEVFDKMKSQRFCAFVDVNFHGFKKEPVSIPAPTLNAEAYREFMGPVDKDDETPTLTGRAIYLANSGLTTSPDGPNNGIFTMAVLDALRGKADKDGYEPDGVVTTDELGLYLEKEVPVLAQKYGKTDVQKDQYARVYESPLTHFVLTNNPTVAEQVRKRVNTLSSLAEEKKIAADAAAEGKNLLERMPKLKTMQDLRKEYQKLTDGAVTPDEFTKNRTRCSLA